MNLKKIIFIYACLVSSITFCVGDVVNVAIFLEPYDGEMSTEIKSFEVLRNGIDTGGLVKGLIGALNSKVDVVVASAPLLQVISGVLEIKQKDLKRMLGTIKARLKLAKRKMNASREKIKELKKSSTVKSEDKKGYAK